MTHEAGHPAQRPALNSTAAQLYIADIGASCDFYTHKLGFVVDFPVVSIPVLVGAWHRAETRRAIASLP